MKILLIITLIISSLSCSIFHKKPKAEAKEYKQFTDCNAERKNVNEIKNQKGSIKKLNETSWYIQPENGGRYQICDIPSELKVEDLKIEFSGFVKEIKPNEKWSSTPFFLIELKVVK